MIETVLLILALYYCVVILFLTGAGLAASSSDDSPYRPSVSIIIAARNEAENIRRCLDAIERLMYPRHLLDVIVVDDRSEDGTHTIAEEYAARLPFIRVLRALPGSGVFVGKINAVAQGVDISRGEILFFTDADCAVPPGWVERTVAHYRDLDVGLVAGFTLLEGESIFERMQAIDWLALFTVAAGGVRAGIPFTAVGTNLTVRRSSYDEVGGYRGIPFSVTEDYALFRAVTRQKRWQARFPFDTGTLVRSLPCRTWGTLYRQKKRWFLGGRGMDARTLLIFAGLYLFHLAVPVGIILGHATPALLGLGAKVLVDLVLALSPILRFRLRRLLPAFLIFEAYFYLYVLVFPIVVLFGGTVLWKERAFRH